MNRRKLTMFVVVAFLAVSCATPSKLAYLKDMAEGTVYSTPPAPDIRIQTGDRISIRVMTKEPELALPFSDATSSAPDGGAGLYTVDSNGCIDFPVLGRLTVAGHSLEEIRDEITFRIQDKGYIKEPLVRVAIDNFTITVIGQTGQSVMKVENNSINIFEVVANSGLLPVEADIKNVMVVRTEEGKRFSYNINLQSKDVFDSPAYYLRQNDIVYFKPKGLQLTATGETILKVFSSTFSFITAIGYVSWWLGRQ